MRRFFILLSVFLHVALLAWLWTRAPQTAKPSVQTAPANVNTIVEPPAALNVNPPSEADAKSESSTKTNASTNTTATPLNPAANPNLATVTSKTPPNNASNNSATNASPQSGNPLNKQANQAAASSTDKPSATVSNPATSPKAAAPTTPLQNTPLTRAMSCPAFAKRQAIVGQITVHVTMSTDGSVKSASVNRSADGSMNDLALAQAKQLKFPIMRNADGVAVESFANVVLKYDCRDN